jgi:hypothetical protein
LVAFGVEGSLGLMIKLESWCALCDDHDVCLLSEVTFFVCCTC